jgi:hypothetical protein
MISQNPRLKSLGRTSSKIRPEADLHGLERGLGKKREPGFWLTAVAGNCPTPLINCVLEAFIGEGSPV